MPKGGRGQRMTVAAGVVAAVMLVATVTACADGSGSGDDTVEPAPEPTTTTATPTPTPTPTPTQEETPIDANDPEALAIADLADHADVSADAIDVLTNERVTWRDGSLGCPEPGMMYTQALVEGYRIVLQVDGQDFAYHGADGGAPSRCDNPDPNGTVANPNT